MLQVCVTEFCSEVGEFGDGLLSNAWMVKHFGLLQTEHILHEDVGKSHRVLEEECYSFDLKHSPKASKIRDQSAVW